MSTSRQRATRILQQVSITQAAQAAEDDPADGGINTDMPHEMIEYETFALNDVNDATAGDDGAMFVQAMVMV